MEKLCREDELRSLFMDPDTDSGELLRLLAGCCSIVNSEVQELLEEAISTKRYEFLMKTKASVTALKL